ncbi:TerB family tellurite resistance protein [Carboxylicivirga caseinilyticus]|uniref:TerB family tellurite resistance protein n=1 Tax=Carboxylicivirga caseinilyticus TaxID=3417572 RepID=UPI003D337CB2|nr:TerB family tellurite resistance protein [Marinilabiliaceae bacterium A049]
MGFWGSIIGAGLGWWTLGPIGAIMGLVLGNMTEEQSKFLNGQGRDRTTQSRNGFLSALLVLVAAVMKADGKVVRSELDFVKRSLILTFGEKQASDALILLRDILKQDIPVKDVVHQIRVNVSYDARLQLLHLLYGIAKADGHFAEEEIRLIELISHGLGISNGDFESIKGTYGTDLKSLYKVLEIDESASNEEVKKAYRKMAVRFHPDKVAHLGDDIKKSAEEKFKKVNEAYEKIRKERNMK